MRGALHLVRLAPKDGRQSLLRRPIQRLYPLEISQAAREKNMNGDEATETSREPHVAISESNGETNRGCPKRKAAQISEGKRRAGIEELSENN